MKPGHSQKFFFLLIGLIVIVIASNLYFYYYKQNFDLVFELDCNPEKETCFKRSCEQQDCPPNQLETYKVFVVEAHVFNRCEQHNCAQHCTLSGQCREIVCGESEGDVCSTD